MEFREQLKRARTEKGLSIREICQFDCLDPAIYEALEQGLIVPCPREQADILEYVSGLPRSGEKGQRREQ